VNIDIQDVTETRKTLAVSFEASETQEEESKLLKQFVQQVKVPGFRPGKVPASMVRQRFSKQLAAELKQSIVRRAYQEGSKESKLDLVQVVDLKDGEVSAGSEALVSFTVDVNPAFELADYKGIAIAAPAVVVEEKDIDETIERIRSERAEFIPVEREASKGDYVKFSHEGSVEGQPISEIAPDKPVYAKMPQTWEEIGTEHGLIPGLSDGLAGLKPGDKKEIEVSFPGDFTVEALQGRQAVYAVEVQEVREKKMPELDDAFLESQKVDSVDALREQIAGTLNGGKEQERRATLRRQVSKSLSESYDFPLPESSVERETELAMRSIVESNVQKGVPQEKLEENKEQIHAESRAAAAERVKLQLILGKIAEKESIEVGDQEFSRYIMMQAYQSGQKPDDLVKELRKDQGRIAQLQASLLYDKTLEFLIDQATVSDS